MDIKIKNEQVVVNGKPMPFSAEELTKIINIMKKQSLNLLRSYQIKIRKRFWIAY